MWRQICADAIYKAMTKRSSIDYRPQRAGGAGTQKLISVMTNLISRKLKDIAHSGIRVLCRVGEPLLHDTQRGHEQGG